MIRKIFYVLVFFAALLVAALIVANLGFYAVLEVNGDSVRAREYNEIIAGFKRYQSISTEPLDEESVRRGIIMSLVGDLLTAEELERRGIGPEKEENLVDSALSDGGKIKKASSELYGWSLEEFKKFALLPQARRDLLSKTLSREGIDFDDWLSSALLSADVEIHFLPYGWEKGRVVDR